jgi:protein TonB
MTRRRPVSRAAGWLLAGGSAVGLIGGAAAFALAAERRPPVLVLDLGAEPPAAPAIAAVAEATPEIAASSPSAPELHDTDEAAPVVPETTPGPALAAAEPLALPDADVAVAADLSLPPQQPEAMHEPTPRPKPRPDARPRPEPEMNRERPVAEPEVGREPATASASASAPSAAARPKGGGMSPETYARAVLKKVRSTKTKPGVGKGVAVVGFTIGADGGLRAVKILQSSGNAELDEVALDHIRRSAPFPAPPADAVDRGYSFEFVAK